MGPMNPSHARELNSLEGGVLQQVKAFLPWEVTTTPLGGQLK
jgi:hypothetical protein